MGRHCAFLFEFFGGGDGAEGLREELFVPSNKSGICGFGSESDYQIRGLERLPTRGTKMGSKRFEELSIEIYNFGS